jgi:hypothetical protein
MKVQLAYPWTDDKGKTHAPDSVVTIPDDQARRLIHEGFARAVSTQDKE